MIKNFSGVRPRKFFEFSKSLNYYMPHLVELRVPDSHVNEIRRQPFSRSVIIFQKKKVFVHTVRVMSSTRLGPIWLRACKYIRYDRKD